MIKVIRRIQDRMVCLISEIWPAQFSFNLHTYREKKVLIIGAAEFCEEELLALDSERFDLVVMFNNSINRTYKYADGEIVQCNILYTNLESKFDLRRKLRAGLQQVLVRVPEAKLFHKYYNFFLSNFTARQFIKYNPISRWSALKELLNGACPTQGFVAIKDALEGGAVEVRCIGFSFFKTEWVEGHSKYSRAEYKMPKEHRPNLEAELLRALVIRYQGRLSLGFRTAQYVLETKDDK